MKDSCITSQISNEVVYCHFPFDISIVKIRVEHGHRVAEKEDCIHTFGDAVRVACHITFAENLRKQVQSNQYDTK